MSFASQFGRGLVAAMEEENLGEGDPTVELPAVDSAESSLIEANDAAAAVDAGTGEIEQTQADSETLADIADTLEASEADGGADPVAAEIAEVAVEAIYNRLGIKSRRVGIEGFADKATRVRSTRIAVEELNKTIKKIWEAIVNAFNKVVEYVKSFVAALFDGTERLLQRADSLEKRLNGVKGTPKADAKITGSVVKALSDSKGASKETALKFLAQGPKVAASVAAVAKIANAGDVNIKEVVQSKEKFDGFSLKATAVPGSEKLTESAPEGLEWITLGGREVPGNKRIAVTVAKSELKGAEAFAAGSKFSVRIVPANAKLDLKDASLAVLSKEEGLSAVGEVRSTVKAIIAQKNAADALSKSVTQLISEARSAATMGNEEDKEITGRSRTVQGFLTASVNTSVKASVVILKEATTMAKAGLDYVEASLKEFNEVDGEKKADEKK